MTGRQIVGSRRPRVVQRPVPACVTRSRATGVADGASLRGGVAVVLAVVVLLAFARGGVAAQGSADVPLAILADPAIVESSGLVASRRQPGVLWTHNDSGDAPRLYATDRQGRALGTFLVPDATNVDWEDLAIGPGQDGDALYVADTGDNERRRVDAAIYRIPEPFVHPSEGAPEAEQTTAPAARFPVVFPDGPRDVETLLLHPRTGEVQLITKESGGSATVFRLSSLAEPDPPVTASFVTDLALPGIGPLAAATGGGVAPAGDRFVVRTPLLALEWTVAPGQTLADAIAERPRRVALPATLRGEAIAYRADGAALLLTAEGVPCPLFEVPIQDAAERGDAAARPGSAPGPRGMPDDPAAGRRGGRR